MTEANVRILAVDDDPRILDLLRRGLVYEGYQVDTATDGQSALATARDNPPDLVVLDWMLPGMDGLEICRRLRAGGDVPILLLTAKSGVPDRVRGLDSGADDYLVKPFSFDELLARVRALARRELGQRPTVLAVGDLRLDAEIPLSSREVSILEAFMRRPGQILSRYDLLEVVWDGEFDHRSNVVEVAI